MTIHKDADLEAYKKFKTITGDAEDDRIKQALESAFNTAEKRTGLTLNRVLGGTDGKTIIFKGKGGATYIPPLLPLVAVKSLTIGGTAVSASASIWSPGYYVDGNVINLRLLRFSKGAEVSIAITYGLETIPGDLHQAILKLAAFEREYPSHVGQKSTSGVTKEQVTYVDQIPADIAAVFDSYAPRFL